MQAQNESYLTICLSLIEKHYAKDEYEFKKKSIKLAENLKSEGKEELADYILAQIFPETAFVPM